MTTKNEIPITYKNTGKSVEVKLGTEKETIWLSLQRSLSV